MKRILALFTLIIFLSLSLSACKPLSENIDNTVNIPPVVEVEDDIEDVIDPITEDPVIEEPVIEDPIIEEPVIDEDGLFISRDEVALYIATYQKLPSNYMTKSEASGGISSYWTPENFASIGGDIFQNRERLLPILDGRIYYELDINYQGGSRGSERIVFSDDGLIFYTANHYASFVLYDKETTQWTSY